MSSSVLVRSPKKQTNRILIDIHKRRYITGIAWDYRSKEVLRFVICKLKNSKVGGVTQSKSREANMFKSQVQFQRLKNQDSLRWKAWEPGARMDRSRWMSCLKERENSPFPHLFVLLQPSMDWVMPIYIGEGRALLSLPIQMPVSSGNTVRHTPEIMS